MPERAPYRPTAEEWPALYGMLCSYCARQGSCEIVDRMIDMKNGSPWPEGGWVTDPGSEVTCLSYEPSRRPTLSRPVLRRMRWKLQSEEPCAGCAARKGSEASVSLHTRRDFAAAVADRSQFLCHEGEKPPCAGWLRAIEQRRRRHG